MLGLYVPHVFSSFNPYAMWNILPPLTGGFRDQPVSDTARGTLIKAPKSRNVLSLTRVKTDQSPSLTSQLDLYVFFFLAFIRCKKVYFCVLYKIHLEEMCFLKMRSYSKDCSAYPLFTSQNVTAFGCCQQIRKSASCSQKLQFSVVWSSGTLGLKNMCIYGF